MHGLGDKLIRHLMFGHIQHDILQGRGGLILGPGQFVQIFLRNSLNILLKPLHGIPLTTFIKILLFKPQQHPILATQFLFQLSHRFPIQQIKNKLFLCLSSLNFNVVKIL